jgi:sporulation protein YlmC with PRC-barrel domain
MKPRKVFLGDLLGCKIVTAQGKMLGRIHDVEISKGPEYQVRALLYGKGSIAHHLHLLNPFRSQQREPPRPLTVPWQAVASFEAHIVRLREEFDEQKLASSHK